MLLAFILLQLALTPIRIDFGSDGSSEWYVLNDGVMGGRSTSQIKETEYSILFSGTVSLKNNGGFASVRGDYQKSDLTEFSKVVIRYRATGRQFSFQLETNPFWYQPNYKLLLEPTGEDWETVESDLLDLQEFRVGRKTGNKLSESELQEVIRLGFITEEKREGDFILEVDYIEFQ